jgi:WD40 repeat protein
LRAGRCPGEPGKNDGTVRLWTLEGKPAAEPFKGVRDTGGVWSVAFSPDRTRIVSGGIDGTVPARCRRVGRGERSMKPPLSEHFADGRPIGGGPRVRAGQAARRALSA